MTPRNLVLTLMTLGLPGAAGAATCESLTTLPLANTTVTMAQTVAAGSLKSTWVMPAMDYAYLSEDDLAAIIAYLHTLPAAGPASIFGFFLRRMFIRTDATKVK